MRMLRRLFLAAGLAVLCGYGLAADAGGEPKTLMTERGKLLFSDDFAQAPGKEWKTAKGKWEVVDGAVRGSELKSDSHGAVTRHALPVKNAVIQYSFKLDGTRQTSLSINDAKGHNSRVVINPAGFSVRKDSHDKNVSDKSALLDQRSVAIKPGEWHTIVVELLGKEMLARLDGEAIAYGAHDSIDVTKSNLGLTVAGESASFKNLRVWEAQPNPSWEATKAKVLAERSKK